MIWQTRLNFVTLMGAVEGLLNGRCFDLGILDERLETFIVLNCTKSRK
jgi:hypothetical protein